MNWRMKQQYAANVEERDELLGVTQGLIRNKRSDI